MGLLAGRPAVVAGAAQGIGLAVARAFAEHGGQVVLADLAAGRAREATASLGADGIVGLTKAAAKEPPLALAGIKATFGRLPMGREETLDHETSQHVELLRTEDFAEGVAAFRERRAPVFRGR